MTDGERLRHELEAALAERQRLEEALRRSEKLEAVGRLAFGVAHDFNNVLTVIRGHSDLMLRRLPREDPFRHNIEDIKRAVDSGMALTRKIMVLRPADADINGDGGTFLAGPPPAAEAPAGPTVLLVEDEAAVQELIREILELHGYTVLVADDGGEAVELGRRHAGPIQLVIADVVSRGAGGEHVIGELLTRHPEARTLYISGYLEDVVVERGARHGGRFLQKPFTVEALLAKVREVLAATERSATG